MATYASGAVQESSDGCLNCHTAAGVDQSYLWPEASTAPVPITPGSSEQRSAK